MVGSPRVELGTRGFSVRTRAFSRIRAQQGFRRIPSKLAAYEVYGRLTEKHPDGDKKGTVGGEAR